MDGSQYDHLMLKHSLDQTHLRYVARLDLERLFHQLARVLRRVLWRGGGDATSATTLLSLGTSPRPARITRWEF